MNKEQIRNILSVMERGKSIHYFNHNVWVTFNMHGEFNVFNGISHVKHTTTTSLKEAVKYTHLVLNS